MTRVVKAERFSLSEAWQVACSYADGNRDDKTKSKWTSLLKRYPDISMPLYEIAKVKEIRDSVDVILYHIPFGISPRIVLGMLNEGVTGVNKPEPGTKVTTDDSGEDTPDQTPVIRKVATKPAAKSVEQNDIAAMLAQMEGSSALEEV